MFVTNVVHHAPISPYSMRVSQLLSIEQPSSMYLSTADFKSSLDSKQTLVGLTDVVGAVEAVGELVGLTDVVGAVEAVSELVGGAEV